MANERPTVAMDGFSKAQPLKEGSLQKGGLNTTSQITERPPAPAPMRISPSASTATSVPVTNASSDKSKR